MKIRRITRTREGNTSYRFVDADTGEMLRNSRQPFLFAVLAKLDDDHELRPFSFHKTAQYAGEMAYRTRVALQGSTVVEIEVEPS